MIYGQTFHTFAASQHKKALNKLNITIRIMITKKLLVIGSMAVMGTAFVSCSSNEDLFDEGAIIKQLDATYAANFEKRYGKIDPDQTWDFSTDTPTFSPASSGSSTRAAASVETANFDRTVGSMDIQKEISEYMSANLPKGQNNSTKGRKFEMVIGENDFTVVPLFQGCASYYWELWMTVEGVGESKVWSKGEGLKYRKAGTNDAFQNVGTGKDGMDSDKGPYEVQAPIFTYNNLPTGKSMFFSLRVWTGGYSQYQKYEKNPLNEAYQPIINSSVDAWMLDLQNAPVPNGLPEGYTATIIGCEDAKDDKGDKDFEDLVFMVYGKPVPPTKRVEEVIEQKSKRYIMEDLGETDDFDFNDVVFDISYDRKKITYIYDNIDATEPSDTQTESLPNLGVVRAAGGTLDFEIQIADKTVWSKSGVKTISTTDMVNTQPGYNPNYVLGEFDATGYNASTNNVSVTVENRGNNLEGVLTIPFPEAGVAPKIVAVPVITQWMTERTKVPAEWFTPKSQQ